MIEYEKNCRERLLFLFVFFLGGGGGGGGGGIVSWFNFQKAHWAISLTKNIVILYLIQNTALFTFFTFLKNENL
jgi:hypothetical protein